MSESLQRESEVSVDSVRKSFANEEVLRGIDLEIEPGEFCVIVGPSGSGKSTLLKCIAGLLEFDSGSISMQGRDMAGVPVEDRDIGFVFQDFEDRLFPHMTVEENVAFGLQQRDDGIDDAEIDERITEVLDMLAISEIRDDIPSELSGGQQQRVELARQFVRRCDVMLLDDPLADLDYKLQKRMELEMRSLHSSLESTFVYVTHNQDQALKLADKLVVMNGGMIEQVGTPDEVYSEPETAFVARFVGDSNPLLGTVTGVKDDHVVLDTEVGEVLAKPQDATPKEGDETIVLIRPMDITLDSEVGEYDNTLDVEVRNRTYTGEHTEFTVAPEGGREFQVLMSGKVSMDAFGDSSAIGWNAADGVCYDQLSVTGTVSVDDLLEV